VYKTVGKEGILRYFDTSIGREVSQHFTRLGVCNTMKQNPQNAVIHLGHTNGVVSLWTPNMGKPVVKMLCHNGRVSDIAIKVTGTIMSTAGLDGCIKLWDLRTYKELQKKVVHRSVTSLDFSQRGILAAGLGTHVKSWFRPEVDGMDQVYMDHTLANDSLASSVRFCPYEDLLGIGHETGFSQIIVPGSGEPNIDTFEANPFENKKQRRETTVVRLLEKIPANMITLNPDRVATVADNQKLPKKKSKLSPKPEPLSIKNKARGKNKPGKIKAKKQSNVVARTKDRFDEDRVERQMKHEETRRNEKVPPPAPTDALNRFKKH